MGLAWTEVGGTVLATEATIMEGKGRLTLTGKLGDVMQESAQAALSYVRARSAQLGLPKDFYKNIDIHMHVPKAPFPKTVLPQHHHLYFDRSAPSQKFLCAAMSHDREITLRGKVLPSAALKKNFSPLIEWACVPSCFRRTMKGPGEYTQEILSSLTIHLVETMDEVLQVALNGPSCGSACPRLRLLRKLSLRSQRKTKV